LYSYEWLLQKREDINYRESKFYEPECYPLWQTMIDFEVDKKNSDIVKNLIEDEYNLTFQEEFACLAIPLKKLHNVKLEFEMRGIKNFLSSLQMHAISDICDDEMLLNWMFENQ